jgi:hypothetical protein
MKVIAPDCFIIDFTTFVVKIGKLDGSTEFSDVIRIPNKSNQFAFPLKTA